MTEEVRVLVETANGCYEVREAPRVYRTVSYDPRTGVRTIGDWMPYDRVGPVRPGEPLRIFVVGAESGRVLSYQVVTTSPVVKVLAA